MTSGLETRPAETWSDEALLAATRAGDSGAYAMLFERHASAARTAARCLGVPPSDAEDIVAEAFTRILDVMRRGGGPDVALRPYLLACVRNACYARSGQRETPFDPHETVQFEDVDGADPLASVTESSVVARAFFSLPARWQQVLWHTEVEGKRPAELTEQLGLSPGAVAALACRAREGLSQAYLHAHVGAPKRAERCQRVTARLPAFVRGKSAHADSHEIQDHLDQCTDCRVARDELRDANRRLRSVLLPAVAGISASSYVGHLGGITRWLRRLIDLKGFIAAAAAAGTIAVGAPSLPSVVGAALPGQASAAAAPTTIAPVIPPTIPLATTAAAAPTPSRRESRPLEIVAPAPATTVAPPPTTTVPASPPAPIAPVTIPQPAPATTSPPTTTPAPTPTTTVTTVPTGPMTDPVPPTTVASEPHVATTDPPPPTPPTPPPPPHPVLAPQSLTVSAGLDGPVVAGTLASISVSVVAAEATKAANSNVVRLTLSPGLTYRNVAGVGWSCASDTYDTGVVTCSMPPLAAGATTTAVVSVAVDPAAASGLQVAPALNVPGAGLIAGTTLALPISTV